MLRRKTGAQTQPIISLPIIEHPLSEGDGGSNRTSIISVEETNHVSTKEYEITDGGNSNMKVVIRVRPENEMEARSNCETVVRILDDHVLAFDPKEDNDPEFQRTNSTRKRRALLCRNQRDLRFAFDRVFDENSKQVDVFKHTTKTVIDGLLDGINCSVFAYGATGAGKTHTMLGSKENPGVMFLTTMELYRRIDQVKHEKNCQIAVTYLEVYNETIRDLLCPSGPLPMREDSSKGLVVTGLSQHQPSSAQDLLHMLDEGNKNRTQHPTDANATSSRSHAVFQVYVNQKPCAAGLSAEVTQGKMSLIDLAGSERGTVTTNKGARFREGANINKSLLALGNCINALASNKDKTCHVPYRNSKLTRLLKDSLGGNCKTVMIANISPSSLSYEDIYNTLKYADRAKQIKTKLIRNVVNVDYHVTRYRTIVVGLQKEIEELRSQLHITNLPTPCFNIEEVDRLKAIIGVVYGERTNLRKNMADLDAAERDTLLRVLRKERELQRIEVFTGNDHKMSKVRGKLDFLHNHIQNIKEQKTVLHLELSKNNESIGKALSDVNSSTVNDSSDGNNILRNHVDLVFDSFKLEAENSYQWKQTKHLLKYIKNQEKEISRTEKILTLSLELVSKQFQLLQATNCSTPVVHDLYTNLFRQIEGEKEVGWLDKTHDNSLHDMTVSSFAPTHQALMETIIAHNSPLRSSTYTSPMNSASLGLLTVSASSSLPSKGIPTPLSPRSPISSFGRVSPAHPLTNRLIATTDQNNSLAGRMLTTPIKSPRTSSSTPISFDYNRGHSSQTFTNRGSSKNMNPCSPMTSPKLKKKRVGFNSPPPAIQEETDFDEEENNFPNTMCSVQVNSTNAKGSMVARPSRLHSSSSQEDSFDREKMKLIKFLKDCTGKNVKQTSAKKVSKTKLSVIENDGKVKSPSHSADSRYTTSPGHSNSKGNINNTSPSKYRINLAELTSISHTTSSSESIKQQQQPVAPMVLPPTPVINAFEDNFVSSYPAYPKPKTNHTPVSKSQSIDNPTYICGNQTFSKSSFTPCRPPLPPLPPRSSPTQSHQFKPVPNQHPAFPPLPTQTSTTPQLPKKPAFLPVSKTKTTTQRMEYRSPINIPVLSLSSLPQQPIPSPSSISKSKSNFKSSSSSSCSQLSDTLTQQQQQGFVLHPASIQISKTTKSHRYSLTSPTQSSGDNVFLSSKESTTSSNDQMNSTFTISKSKGEKRKYAVLELPNDRMYHPKKISPNLAKPLAILQVGLSDSTDSYQTAGSTSSSTGERKQPNYLTLTKSAAFKKVQKTAHQNLMKNQKENWNISANGMLKTQSTRTKSKTIRNRSLNNRSQSVSISS